MGFKPRVFFQKHNSSIILRYWRFRGFNRMNPSHTGTSPEIPADHPRAKSLHYRHLLVEGMEAKVVTPSGLCAHGRGEAFDYLLGEQTPVFADQAIYAAVAALLSAKHPIISINGNVAALIPNEITDFSNLTNIPMEINLFYRAPGRVEAIEKVLKNAGARLLYGTSDAPQAEIKELSSNRRIVDPRGIAQADVVLVPLEDGDRTEALIKEGKFVITVDLNPLSRTAQKAHITIVDNIIRCVPRMTEIAKELLGGKSTSPDKTQHLKTIVNNFNQQQNLIASLQSMITYLQEKIKALE
jgi:4-phosphopantoate--beta-alanine ligase